MLAQSKAGVSGGSLHNCRSDPARDFLRIDCQPVFRLHDLPPNGGTALADRLLCPVPGFFQCNISKLQRFRPRLFRQTIPFHSGIPDGRLILVEQAQVMIEVLPRLRHQPRGPPLPFRLYPEDGSKKEVIERNDGKDEYEDRGYDGPI